MPSPRRKAKRYMGRLTSDEQFALSSFAPIAFDSEEEARAAWAEHKDELAPKRRGLAHWAAIVFDGQRGHSSHYCHLGNPNCGCRYARHPERAWPR